MSEVGCGYCHHGGEVKRRLIFFDESGASRHASLLQGRGTPMILWWRPKCWGKRRVLNFLILRCDPDLIGGASKDAGPGTRAGTPTKSDLVPISSLQAKSATADLVGSALTRRAPQDEVIPSPGTRGEGD